MTRRKKKRRKKKKEKKIRFKGNIIPGRQAYVIEEPTLWEMKKKKIEELDNVWSFVVTN